MFLRLCVCVCVLKGKGVPDVCRGFDWGSCQPKRFEYAKGLKKKQSLIVFNFGHRLSTQMIKSHSKLVGSISYGFNGFPNSPS